MEDVDTFYGHLVYFCGQLVFIVTILYVFVIFSSFGKLNQEKSGNPSP
jgi:hypothetical protein